jgi:predicted RNA-binding Zn-ribbon protein involved in translation (DUF1610 family)
MAATDSWLVIGAILFIVLVIALGAGLLWGAYQLSRSRRQARVERDFNYQPPPFPLPPEPSPPAEPMIRWGDTATPGAPPTESLGTDRIRWGSEWEWAEVSSTEVTDANGTIRCPICKRNIIEHQSDAFVCPECQTVYHQRCWREYGEICLVCRRSST